MFVPGTGRACPGHRPAQNVYCFLSGVIKNLLGDRDDNTMPPGRDAPTQQTRVYPYPLGAGTARPNPKMGAPDPENPLFLGFSVLRGGLRPWSQTMVSEGARPWGRGRSGDCDLHCTGKRLSRTIWSSFNKGWDGMLFV